MMDSKRNFLQTTLHRESSVINNVQYRHYSHVIEPFVRRLGLESKLQGHTGCVNCLEWNEKGSLLASGSDDVQVMLWDPFSKQKVAQIQTGHTGNIFSVKFLPQSNDNVVVSGAADHKVLVHDVNQQETTQVFTCHASRVKRLATAPNLPFIFWSASEDGTIRQFDLRSPELSSESNPQNVLVNLHAHSNSLPEAKCLAINPMRPHLLAVGTNDPFVRLYDRRMLSCRSVRFPNSGGERLPWDRSSLQPEYTDGDTDQLPRGCVQYYIAGHLPVKYKEYRRKYRNLASTFVTFSADGSELLVNMGGEQIYLFDINSPREAKTFDPEAVGSKQSRSKGKTISPSLTEEGPATPTEDVLHALSHSTRVTNGHNLLPEANGKTQYRYVGRPLPRHVELVEQQANSDFEQGNFIKAIERYNYAIALYPDSAKLYGNRAAAFLKRRWDGDVYAALRDCLTALELDSNHMKAHFRLAKCLHELAWDKEAQESLAMFLSKFPDSGSKSAVESLHKDIEAAIYAADVLASKEKTASSSSSSGSSSSGFRSGRKEDEQLSENEQYWRGHAYDYKLRFCGHCNTTTDIKEANFFGSKGQYIMAGSDDGKFLIWDKATTNVVKVLKGDESIVNCLQPHPESCLLATSGIEPVVNLWSPSAEDGIVHEWDVIDGADVATANQRRMNADPLEVMLLNMGYARLLEDEEQNTGNEGVVSCRTS